MPMNMQQRRDAALQPLSAKLTAFHIRPIMVTIGGVVAMAIAAILIAFHLPIIATLCILISLAADLIDGSLARYQRTESNKGRIVDIVADTLSFSIFTFGLAQGKLMSSSIAWALIILYAAAVWMNTRRAIASTRHTGLQIYELHGFWIIPSIVKALMYTSFIIGIAISSDTIAILRLIAVLLLAFSLVRSTLKKA